MKKKAVKLAIEEPCHEDWNTMTPQEQGRYCGVCSKVVVDFTNMSDREVLNLLDTTKNGDTCGQFTQTQLQKTYHYPVQETNSFSLRAVLLGATLTSVLGLESCRPNKHVVGKISSFQTMQSANEDTLRNEELMVRGNMIATYNHQDDKRITGKVMGEGSIPLQGATVQLFSSKDLALGSSRTDEKGIFSLALDWKKEPTYYRISRPGFESIDVVINQQPTLSDVEYTLMESELMIKGKVKMD